MSNTSLQQFDFNGNGIKVLMIEGNPWFVAQDVCSVLDLGNVSKACNPLKDREKNTITLSDGNAGNPTTLIISESGLYRLTMKSRKPQAEPFQDWVCEEVLPSIRKTGKYETPSVPTSTPSPALPSRVIALETAKSVFEIKDMLADSDPRLCQMLVDVAINDAMAVIKAIAPASETKWMGAVEIAESLKLPVTTQNRTTLGKFVKATCGNLGKQEERICNGRMMPIWCYPMPNKDVEAAVRKFFD